jgi:hypothetical protein
VGVVVGVFCQVCGASIINAALTGAAIGAVSAAATGGNILQGALLGGLTAGAAKYIGGSSAFGEIGKKGVDVGRALAHGVVGGTVNVLRGGKFGTGFMSSAFTKMVSGNIKGFARGVAGGINAGSKIIGVASVAIVGGTASVLGGGKFANGAQTAAIQYLFNQVATDDEPDAVKLKIGFTTKRTGKNSSATLSVDDAGDFSGSAKVSGDILSGSVNTNGEANISLTIYDRVKSFVKSLSPVRVNDQGNIEAGYSKGGVGIEIEIDPKAAILNTPTGKLFSDPMRKRECAAGLRTQGC